MNFKFFTLNPKTVVPAILALLLGQVLLHAELGYTTTFDDYSVGFSLSGNVDATTWDTNDADTGNTWGVNKYVGQSDTVYEPGAVGDYWASVGGLVRPNTVPGAPITKVWKSFDVSTGNGGNGGLYFSVDFSISSSSVAYPNKDDFAFGINDALGNQYAALRFSPVTTGLTGTDSNKLYIILDQTGGPSLTASLGDTYDNVLHLTLNITDAKKITIAVTDLFNNTSILWNSLDITATGIVPDQVKQVSANWILKNTTTTAASPSGVAYTSAGKNALNFNNYSVVPEPSTVGLSVVAGLGATIVAFRRRRARL